MCASPVKVRYASVLKSSIFPSRVSRRSCVCARLRTPIEIGGHLRKPSIGVNAGKTLKQGAIAAALGTVLTPLAAVVAFVDPGLAKDENCSALLSTRTADSTGSKQR